MTNNKDNTADELAERIRSAYLQGQKISSIVKNEPQLVNSTPVEVMEILMRVFHVALSDVSCIDGWWPPFDQAEVTDENLDLFIGDAIEKSRGRWRLR